MFGGFKNLGGGSGDIVSYIGLSGTEKYMRDMHRIDSAVKRSGANAMSMGQKFGKAAKMITVAALVIGAATVGMAAKFEKKMANVHTLLDVTHKEFEKLSSGVIDISTRIGHSADSLSVALYDLVSAGAPAASALKSLEIAGKAATAGVTDTKTAVRAGMSVINAYALSINKLNKVYDIQFKTVKKGVLTFEQYSSAIGTVLPQATALGVSLEGLHAGFAVLTKAGQSAEMATTNLSRGFQAFVEQQDKFKKLGISIFDVSGKFRGLIPIITDLSKIMHGLTDEQKQAVLQTLNLDIRASRAIISLTGLLNTSGGLVETFAEMKDSAGAMGEAFRKIEQTTAHQFDIMKAGIGALAIEIGNELLPFVNDLVTDFTKWVTEARKSGELKDIFEKIGGTLEKIWIVTKEIGGWAIEHGDLILALLGSIIFTKIVAVVATLTANITTLAAALGTLKKVLMGGWFAKAIVAVGAGTAALAAAAVATAASLGIAINEFAKSHKDMGKQYVLLDKMNGVWLDMKTGIKLVQDEWGNWVEWGKQNTIPYIEAVTGKIEKLKENLEGLKPAGGIAGDPRLAEMTSYLDEKIGGIKGISGGVGQDLIPINEDVVQLSNSYVDQVTDYIYMKYQYLADIVQGPLNQMSRDMADSFFEGGKKISDIFSDLFKDLLRQIARFITSQIVKAFMQLLMNMIMPGSGSMFNFGSLLVMPKGAQSGEFIRGSRRGQLRNVGEGNTDELIIPINRLMQFMAGQYTLPGGFNINRIESPQLNRTNTQNQTATAVGGMQGREQVVKVVVETVAPDLARVKTHYEDVEDEIGEPRRRYKDKYLRQSTDDIWD